MLRRCALPFLRTLAPDPRSSLSRTFASSRSVRDAPPVFQAQRASVFPFGVPSNDPSQALFNDLDLTIHDQDCWAILAPSSSSPTREALLATIRHQARFHPISSASYPILAALPPVERPAEEGGPRERTVEDLLQFVSFKTRLERSGAFDDYTARYYSIRDEDKLTVRQHLKDSTGAEDVFIAEKAKDLQLTTLLDLPLITLSNGQTRRARILKALLSKPELLILEEPFTGLDASSRGLLSSLLSSLHSARSPRVLLVLRPQDVLPSFVTHIALADASPGMPLKLGRKDEILSTNEARELLAAGEAEREASKRRKEERQAAAAKRDEEAERRKTIVQLKGVNISYGRPFEGQEERRVLKNVDWTIREGERWVLAGSGKSTLLALLLGDHPRSFTEDIELFGKPRLRQATATLQANIGHVSPEIFNAFPRRYGPDALSGYDAIVTGFDSVYSYRKATSEQASTISSLLSRFSHPLLTPCFLDRPFASLSPGEQSLILLLRALVKRPPLLVLDEPFSGMDMVTIEKVQRYIDAELEDWQSVVLITHFEEEVPKSVGRLLRLEDGEVVERV
ncbi:ABC transporter [Rhodotorula toruloides]|uniref:ABC transporter n=1 Tax=Rhodotorula toruloides TaxID=5286 RepID=A0A511K7R1_RHOTO|nr:ABC transporter [Rhodotorula toruloides]